MADPEVRGLLEVTIGMAVHQREHSPKAGVPPESTVEFTRRLVYELLTMLDSYGYEVRKKGTTE